MRSTLWLIIFMNICFVTVAQPGDPPGDPGDPVPLTGVELLLVAGGALGGYSIFRKSQRQKD